ncbi:hypothetical protein [Nocardia farcinica]|uniref:hypothetical protein n=1 Tax=Nocardia farcinica TaxID=37329 RepID=UPI002454EC04|nr:hypothetical protein [Nocardia farcinica]
MAADDTFGAIFYSLPAELVEPGMSTDDGQDVLDVELVGDEVILTVYAPHSDDPELDAHNRAAPETRCRTAGAPVGLAAFIGIESSDSADEPALLIDSDAKEQRRVCRSGDCDNAPDDGDGWDGYCRNRADRLAADEFDD